MMPSEWTPPKRRRRLGWTVGLSLTLVGVLTGLIGGIWLSQSHPGELHKVLSAVANKRNAIAKTFTLPGHVIPALHKAKDTGNLASDRTLKLSIALPLRNPAALRALIANQYNPQSPLYHHFLTTAQFTDAQTGFSPTPETIKAVSDYLTASGLTVTGSSASRQFINVTGSAANVETAFHVQLHEYTVNGQTYYGPVNDPAVSSSLAGLVQNISGLDNYSVYRPNFHLNAQAHGYTPTDLQKAYGADKLISQGYDGSGQSIAFLELSGFDPADVQAYQQKYGVAGATIPQPTLVDGGPSDNKGATEVELDMEIASAIAPKATQLVYEGPNTGQGINDVYSQIVTDNKAKIVSISWGLCEQALGSAELQTLDQIFQQGASQGMAFFAAAGDTGAYDCGDGNLSVDSPADDPLVTGVGGTALSISADGTYGGETAWSCATCTKRSPQGSGGGGGISQQFGLPTFQNGLQPSGVNTPARFVPDVAANADPATGYAVYCTVSEAGCDSAHPDLVAGGTSAAAPLWAAGMALINQALTQQGKSAVGNANAAIYASAQASPAAFHDVQQGDNLFYHAGPGYDLATGLGSPDFAALEQAIANGPGTTGNPPPSPTPNPGGSPTATPNPSSSPTATPTPGTGQELLANNGFENGQSPWSQNSAGNYQLIDSENPHNGNYNADLCGYDNCNDIIAQAFVVPQQYASVTLSYQWEMVTKEAGGCNDHFNVDVYSVTDNGDGTISLGQSIAQAQAACNSDANSTYALMTVDLTNKLHGHEGQTLALVFHTTSDSANPTRVFVDDVSLQAR